MNLALLAVLALGPRDELQELLRRLDDDTPAVREAAAVELGRRPLSDLPALEKAYAEAEADRRDRLRRILPSVRCRRYEALAQEPDVVRHASLKEAAEALLRPDAAAVLAALRNVAGQVPDRLVAALVDVYREDEIIFRYVLTERAWSIPAAYMPRIAACLEGPDLAVVRSALARLKVSPSAADLPKVSERTNAIAASAGHPVRLEAIAALPALGDERSGDVLLRASEAAEPEISRAALRALLDYLRRRPARAALGRSAAAKLSSRDPELRRCAYELLALAPNRAEDLGRVKSGLADEDAGARWGALELAAAVGDESVFDGAVALLEGPEHVKAIETLFRLSPLRAVERLNELYARDPDFTEAWLEHLQQREEPALIESIRRTVVRLLREGHRDQFGTMLRAASQVGLFLDAAEVARPTADSDASNRGAAFDRVGSASGPAAVEVIRAGLRDPELSVRRSAVEAAGRAKATACVDEVIHLLGADPELRTWAIRALGRIGDRKALPTLLNWLSDREYGVLALDGVGAMVLPEDVENLLEQARRIDDATHRARVVGAAASVLGDGSRDRLLKWLDERRLRTGALEALATAKVVEAAGRAEQYLDDSDPRTVRAAAKLVGEAGRASAVPALLLLVDDPDVAEAAVEALSKLPKAAVVPGLAPLLKSREVGVRLAAASGLEAHDADELVVAVGELLGESRFDLVRIGLRTVRRRGIRERLVDVERLTARSDPFLRREALETLAALDWEGFRAGLLKRLRDGEKDLLRLAGPHFAARGDREVLPLLLDGMGRADEAGYDALVVLNGYRKREATARAREPRFNSTGTIPGANAWRKARSLSESIQVPLRVELPASPGPRASFEKDFDRTPGRSRTGGGGGRYGSRFGAGGVWSVFDRILAGLGRDLVPVVEDDVIRLLPRDKAVDFWRAWAAERK